MQLLPNPKDVEVEIDESDPLFGREFSDVLTASQPDIRQIRNLEDSLLTL